MNRPTGKLGVLTPGLGAVATTFIAGVMAVRNGISKPFGSVTQMQTIRLGSRDENRSPLIKDLLPLANLDDIVFGAWDPFENNAYGRALEAGVLSTELVEQLRPELEAIVPMAAAFEQEFVPRLTGVTNVKPGNKRQQAESLRRDIQKYKDHGGCDRVVMIWCGSTEVHLDRLAIFDNMAAFERALDRDDRRIAPSMLYAYAAIMEGVPFANGAPNLTADIPSLEDLAGKQGVPLAGKDFKTGQTLMKTVIAPGLKARMLGISGWFSTNILGNRDGEVLAEPEAFKTKEASKLGVLESVVDPTMYPDLYGDMDHQVHIQHYRPRGDRKEGWDNVDIFGWLGYPMQIKINFLCRDSILAAPLVLDLALLLDLAQRNGQRGVIEPLSFFFKAPQVPGDAEYGAENDLFIQHWMLKNWMRSIAGEEELTHTEELV